MTDPRSEEDADEMGWMAEYATDDDEVATVPADEYLGES